MIRDREASAGGRRLVRERRGFALVAVMMIGIVGAIIALASAVMAMSNGLVQSGSDRTALVDDAAISGLEETRSRLNAKLDSVPLTGYATLESDKAIPGTNMKRSVWISRLGNSDSLRNVGEFGVQGEVVVKVVDVFGNVAIRRSQLYQDSFARYASFTDQGKMANGATLYWAMGAQAQGPVHSNDTIFVYGANPTPQAVFNDVVTTAKIVKNSSYASFKKSPPQERVSVIKLPEAGDLNVLKAVAAKAGYVFTPNVVTGDSALATMRIEFVAIDVNDDGDVTDDNEGFFKVYQLLPGLAYGEGYAMARPPKVFPANAPKAVGAAAVDDSLLYSYNCGETDGTPRKEDEDGYNGIKTPDLLANQNVDNGTYYEDKMEDKRKIFDDDDTRCFLGGDNRLNSDGKFRAFNVAGYWMPRTSGTIPNGLNGRRDKNYLWPLAAANNPNFRGVIFAEGKVAVSGVVRGRVTVASRNNLMIVHELTQATNPGVTSGTCKPEDDVIGLFSGEYVLYADNALNTPQQRRTGRDGATWSLPRKDFDPSPRRPDLAVHASVLALKSVAAENARPPAGLPAAYFVNRGTLRLIGGTIEARAGLTGTMSGANLHGQHDDLSFNRCLLQYPPPYFPTTGRWSRSQYYEVNPQSFSPAAWFAGR